MLSATGEYAAQQVSTSVDPFPTEQPLHTLEARPCFQVSRQRELVSTCGVGGVLSLTRSAFSVYLLYWYRSRNNDVKSCMPRLYYFLPVKAAPAKAARWAGSDESINSLFALLKTAPPPKTITARSSSRVVK